MLCGAPSETASDELHEWTGRQWTHRQWTRPLPTGTSSKPQDHQFFSPILTFETRNRPFVGSFSKANAFGSEWGNGQRLGRHVASWRLLLPKCCCCCSDGGTRAFGFASHLNHPVMVCLCLQLSWYSQTHQCIVFGVFPYS